MASIRQLVYQIINTVGGGRQGDDTELDERLVQQYVVKAANNYESQDIKKNGNPLGKSLTTFKNIAVQFDSDLNQYYIELPVGYYGIELDKGVFQVSAMKDQYLAFSIIRNGEMAIYKNNAAFVEGDYIRCYPEGSRVYFVDDMGVNGRGIDKCLVKLLIIDMATIDPNADFIDPDMELAVVKEVIQLLGVQQRQPIDQVNDQYKTS